MIKRTSGIEEFEFLRLDEALILIDEHRAERKKQRGIDRKDAATRALELKRDLAQFDAEHLGGEKSGDGEEDVDVLWEMGSEASEGQENKIGSAIDGTTSGKKPVPYTPRKSISDAMLDVPIVPTPDAHRQTNVLITVSGWVPFDRDDHTMPFSTLARDIYGDQHALIWETKVLQDLGSTLTILVSELASFVVQQGLQVTLLPILGALTGPMWLMKLTYLVDNPWGNAMSKADKAGRLLADNLIGQVQSNRPVTLIGFSLGARLIYSCLLELASKGAYGLVESVYLLGTPAIGNKKEWESIASVVSGRVLNGYCTNDMLLGVLYRTSTTNLKNIAGLAPVLSTPGIENCDLTHIVDGHMDYRTQMPKILDEIGFSVTSHEFIDREVEERMFKQEREEAKLLEKQQKELAYKRAQQAKKEEQFAEAERKRMAKEAERERKRIAQEQKVETARLSNLAKAEKLQASKAPYKKADDALVTPDQLLQDELAHMKEVESVMANYWMPKELPSTLGPLVISNPPVSTPTVESHDEDEGALSDF